MNKNNDFSFVKIIEDNLNKSSSALRRNMGVPQAIKRKNSYEVYSYIKEKMVLLFFIKNGRVKKIVMEHPFNSFPMANVYFNLVKKEFSLNGYLTKKSLSSNKAIYHNAKSLVGIEIIKNKNILVRGEAITIK